MSQCTNNNSEAVSFDNPCVLLRGKNCFCNMQAKMSRSWTEVDLGRRYIHCPNVNSTTTPCAFHEWIDGPFDERSVTIVNGLLQRIEQLKGEHLAELLANLTEQQRMKNNIVKMNKYIRAMFVVIIIQAAMIIGLSIAGFIDSTPK